MAHDYSEPIAKSFPLLSVIPPSAYSNSTYYSSPVECASARSFVATVKLGLNIQSSSVINAFFQYSSLSTNSSSAWTPIDVINCGVQFGVGYPPIVAGTLRTLELRAEALNKLPINASRYVRLAVTLASSGSTTEFSADIQGCFWRYPPTSGPFQNGQSSYLSSSISNTIYSTIGPAGGSQIPVS
jgi:hypothetical protein